MKENTPLTTIPPRDYNPKKTILITHKKDHILLFMLIEFETIIIRSMPFIFPFNTLNFFWIYMESFSSDISSWLPEKVVS